MAADVGADDGAVKGTAIGISDEALASVEEVTAVATSTGGLVPGASRAGELPEGVAIERKRGRSDWSWNWKTSMARLKKEGGACAGEEM